MLGAVRPGLAVFGVGDIVFDPTNLVQNTLTALRTLETTINQARQIANEVTMIANQVTQIANQVKELTQLPTSILADITGTVQQYTGLLQQAQGIAYDLSNLQNQFTQLYPSFAGQGITSSTYATVHAPQWAQQTRAALQQAMQAQGILDRLLKVRTQVDTALTASQGAIGNLQVSQAGNQLAGIMTEQLAGLEQILAATGRAQASLMAQEAMADEAARDNAQRLMQGYTTWTPVPVATTLPRLRY